MYEKYCALRDAQNLTDYKVSKETGIPAPTFADWKSGRSKPGVEKLAKLAKFFGVAIEDFLEG